MNKIISNYQSNQCNYKTNFSAQNKQKYDETIKKRNYIEAKTKSLDDFCTGTLLLALLTGALDVDILGKETKKRFAIGLALVSSTAFIINCIRKMKFSKEYERIKNPDEIL